MSLVNLSPKEQDICMQRFKDKALAEALRRCEKTQTTIPFDLQGRVILNVALSQEDVADILKRYPSQDKAAWQALVGHNIVVSLDIKENPKLQEAFDQQLAKALALEAGTQKGKDILTEFNKIPKDGMIALQQALQSYVLSATYAYQESSQALKDKSALLNEAGLEVMEKVNKMVLNAYASALTKAYRDNQIDLQILKKELERGRKNIAILANKWLEDAIFQKTGIRCDRELVKKPLENLADRMKKGFNDSETLQTDYASNRITWTQAHPRAQGKQPSYADRRLTITSDYDKQGQVIEKTPQEYKKFHQDYHREHLQHQVGKYKDSNATNEQVVNRQLANPVAKEKLYKGIDSYSQNHPDQIRNYCKKYKLASPPHNKPDFFRQQFIDYVLSRDLPRYAIPDQDPRATRPDEATIKLADFLGKKGAELYQLALEEERYSQEYMNAVFCASTEHYEGEKWTTRPVILVGGPSSSGKSFAAAAAVKKVNELVLQKPAVPGTTPAGNDVVSVDGGVFRQVSQMRKLAIRLSNQQGYTGISDLHDQSSILDQAKTCLKKAVYAAPSVGVVIPETFSNPLRVTSILKEIEGLPSTKTIFTRVVGEDPATFKRVVGYLGSRRAWKTDWSSQTQTLDLNSTDNLIESKAYGAHGFYWGQRGSLQAEEWYKKNSKDEVCCFHITNDLLLIRPVPLTTGLPKREQWEDADPADASAVKVNRRLYEAWVQSKEPDLKQFIKGKEKTLPALIATEAEYNLQKVIQELTEKRGQYQDEGNIERADSLGKALLAIDHIKSNDDFPAAIDKIKELIPVKHSLTFHQSTREVLSEAVQALEQRHAELRSSETVNQQEVKVSTIPFGLFSSTTKQAESQKQPTSKVQPNQK